MSYDYGDTKKGAKKSGNSYFCCNYHVLLFFITEYEKKSCDHLRAQNWLCCERCSCKSIVFVLVLMLELKMGFIFVEYCSNSSSFDSFLCFYISVMLLYLCNTYQ